MRWEDENYVKLFTRDSLTWKSWSWQARAVFMLLLRKVDAAGILQCEGFDPTEAVALMLEMPREVVDVGLRDLLRTGTAEVAPGAIVLPKFVEAQESRKTERLRKRDQRQRDRDQARAKGFVGSDTGADKLAETERHAESHEVTPDVTRCHAESREVTRCHSSSSSPSSSSSSKDSLVADAPRPALDLFPTEPPAPDPVEVVLAHYTEAMDANGIEARSTPKRRKLVERRLKEGFTPEQLKQAIDGLTWSDWHMGKDPKSEGKSWTDLKYAIGDAERIEENVRRAQSPPSPPQRAGGWR